MTKEYRDAVHIIAWVLGTLVGLPVALLAWAWQIQALSDHPVIYALCWVAIVGNVLVLARKLHCRNITQIARNTLVARAEYENHALLNGNARVGLYGQFQPGDTR